MNLGCGSIFLDSAEWLNIDFAPSSAAVTQANLLERLPMEDGSVELVYSSHFLEHVPRAAVPALLQECSRILAPGGWLRLVLPDLENMCREYLFRREHGEHEMADFVAMEMIDQCVRREPGGEMGRLYDKLRGDDRAEAATMRAYVRERVGEKLNDEARSNHRFRERLLRAVHRGPMAFWAWLEDVRIRLCLSALPTAFRAQNISCAGTGERHHWLWDFHQLHVELARAGFLDITRQSASSSAIREFPFHPLDVESDGKPRKGAESMYVEARKST